MVVAIAESRLSHADGLKNAVLSVLSRVPGEPVHVFAPDAGTELRAWLAGFPAVTVRSIDSFPGGWNLKPAVLLALLDEGHDDVAWLDSDIIVTSDWRVLFTDLPAGAFVATEEFPLAQQRGGSHRATAWGLTAGRDLETTVNTGFIRCTPDHAPLLKAWQAMLSDERYLAAQAMPWQQRPLHLFTDQEVLTGLLAGEEFSTVPLRLLRQGDEIAQCYGASGWLPHDRLSSVRRGSPPVLVHAMGPKPYDHAALTDPGASLLTRIKDRYTHLHDVLAPYPILAKAYDPWRATPPALAALAQDSRRQVPLVRIGLAELPLAVIESVAKRYRERRGIGRLSSTAS